MAFHPHTLLLAAFLGLLAALLPAASASAQPQPSSMSQGSRPLADYTGTYRYHGGTTPALVPADSLLVAIIDEAKYPLRAAGPDRFVNRPGQTIPFRRDAAGTVTGFEEGGTYFERRTPTVDPAIAQLVAARPRDGVAYAYQPPPELGDGIAVGDLAGAGLDASVAEAIVRGAVDGAWPALHSVLMYRRGRLVLEEYFYGGQKIYLVPSLELVAVFTGGAFNADDTPPNAIMARVLLPAMLQPAEGAGRRSQERMSRRARPAGSE